MRRNVRYLLSKTWVGSDDLNVLQVKLELLNLVKGTNKQLSHVLVPTSLGIFKSKVGLDELLTECFKLYFEGAARLHSNYYLKVVFRLYFSHACCRCYINFAGTSSQLRLAGKNIPYLHKLSLLIYWFPVKSKPPSPSPPIAHL